jgi:hypothetical protein
MSGSIKAKFVVIGAGSCAKSGDETSISLKGIVISDANGMIRCGEYVLIDNKALFQSEAVNTVMRDYVQNSDIIDAVGEGTSNLYDFDTKQQGDSVAVGWLNGGLTVFDGNGQFVALTIARADKLYKSGGLVNVPRKTDLTKWVVSNLPQGTRTDLTDIYPREDTPARPFANANGTIQLMSKLVDGHKAVSFVGVHFKVKGDSIELLTRLTAESGELRLLVKDTFSATFRWLELIDGETNLYACISLEKLQYYIENEIVKLPRGKVTVSACLIRNNIVESEGRAVWSRVGGLSHLRGGRLQEVLDTFVRDEMLPSVQNIAV